MKKLFVVSVLILAFGAFFLSCQEAMSPQEMAQDENSAGIQHVISPTEPPPPPPPPPPCDCEPRTPGYWKNHDEWPVDVLTIGETEYTQAQITNMMKLPIKNDKRWTMFKALAAAMLNKAAGCETGCINDVIDDANLWWFDHGSSPVKANKPAWKEGEWFYLQLDDFNNNGC